MTRAGDSRLEPDSAWAQSLALSFRFLFLVVYLLAFLWAVSNVRIVPTDRRAVVLRFGSIAREQGPGLLLAFPEPIERIIVLPSSDRQNQYIVRTLANSPNMLSGDPRWNTGMFLSGDMSVVHLKATLFYRITDATAYVLSVKHVEPALERLFLASAISVCGARDLDTILVARPELETAAGSSRAGRERLRTDLMDEINRRLSDLAQQGASLGITVGRVDLLPEIPGEAEQAFNSVLVAIQSAETRVAEARTRAEQTMQHANQEKDRIVADAQARAAERVTTAQTRTAAIAALARGNPGLQGQALIDQIYADRIGPLLAKAAQVQTISGGAHVILPGALP
ncbi:MAG TPA: SPFH domain-containing protein [Nevskiaceae bacterium]|nr:SPFH domain-containing protein [Nevskiaceae bacterium]